MATATITVAADLWPSRMSAAPIGASSGRRFLRHVRPLRIMGRIFFDSTGNSGIGRPYAGKIGIDHRRHHALPLDRIRRPSLTSDSSPICASDDGDDELQVTKPEATPPSLPYWWRFMLDLVESLTSFDQFTACFWLSVATWCLLQIMGMRGAFADPKAILSLFLAIMLLEVVWKWLHAPMAQTAVNWLKAVKKWITFEASGNAHWLMYVVVLILHTSVVELKFDENKKKALILFICAAIALLIRCLGSGDGSEPDLEKKVDILMTQVADVKSSVESSMTDMILICHAHVGERRDEPANTNLKLIDDMLALEHKVDELIAMVADLKDIMNVMKSCHRHARGNRPESPTTRDDC